MPAYNEDGSYYMSYRAAGSTGRDYIGYNILKELKNTGKSSKMDDFNALLALRLKLWKGLKYEVPSRGILGTRIRGIGRLHNRIK